MLFTQFGHTPFFFFFFENFPDRSVGKESACNEWDPGLIPRSGRSPGEGIGYPLQYSWASLVAQLVKNWPAVWETWVLSLCWEDHLEKGMATHSSIPAWRIPWTVQSMGSWRVRHIWVTFTSLYFTEGEAREEIRSSANYYSPFLLLWSIERTHKLDKVLCDWRFWKVCLV